MVDGSNTRLFDRSSTGTGTSRQHSATLLSAWHRLDPELRFSLVETALQPANNVLDDGFPLTL